MFDLTGEVALVTGGNSGIGLGMADGLARAGADVCIWGRRQERNAEAAEALRAHGTRVEAITCDVSDEEQVIAAFAATLERLGKVDACFANAGVGLGLRPFVEQDLDLWRRTMAVNVEGAVATLREAARHMVERGDGGSLVAVSSTSAIHGAPMNQAYAASKTALLALMRGLAVELARHRIRANSIVPGWTETEMLEPAKANQRFVDATVGRTPMRRWGEPADFGPVAVFLAAREAGFHTGDEIVLDGGYTRF
jgi:NAD(P)-dependent dehydrogenase (short-subunit alcohol dehydrogenase family)